jgi:hypothetical protein
MSSGSAKCFTGVPSLSMTSWRAAVVAGMPCDPGTFGDVGSAVSVAPPRWPLGQLTVTDSDPEPTINDPAFPETIVAVFDCGDEVGGDCVATAGVVAGVVVGVGVEAATVVVEPPPESPPPSPELPPELPVGAGAVAQSTSASVLSDVRFWPPSCAITVHDPAVPEAGLPPPSLG